jgi:hypothetical protein
MTSPEIQPRGFANIAVGLQNCHIGIEGVDSGLPPDSFRDRGVPVTEALGQILSSVLTRKLAFNEFEWGLKHDLPAIA